MKWRNIVTSERSTGILSLQASVIIPAYNAEATIGLCLAGLLNQTAPRSSYEIIVVDDASTDNTAALAARYSVQVVRQNHAGPAAARNLGAQHASGDLLLFTDADCAPTSTWLEAMLRSFQQAEIMGSKGQYLTHQQALAARFVQLEYEEKYQRMAKERYIDFIDTYSAAYRREVFLANGGFDSTFLSASAEDQEFSFRLAEQGFKMVFVPDAVVYHTHPSSWVRYVRRKIRFGYWQALNRGKHPKKLIRDSHTPQSLKLQVALTALLLLVALAGLLEHLWWWAVPLILGCYSASALPLLRLTWEKDRAVMPIAPFMLGLRGAGLLAGFSTGAVLFSGRWLFGKLPHRQQRLVSHVSRPKEPG